MWTPNPGGNPGGTPPPSQPPRRISSRSSSGGRQTSRVVRNVPNMYYNQGLYTTRLCDNHVTHDLPFFIFSLMNNLHRQSLFSSLSSSAPFIHLNLIAAYDRTPAPMPSMVTASGPPSSSSSASGGGGAIPPHPAPRSLDEVDRDDSSARRSRKSKRGRVFDDPAEMIVVELASSLSY